MKLRTIEQQFEPEKAASLRSLQSRLIAIRTTGEASDYFLFETANCLEAGLLLATLQLATSTLELLAREILIHRRTADPNIATQPAYHIETSVEGTERGYAWRALLQELEQSGVLHATEKNQLMATYEKIRIPIHHGIVGRYVRSRESDKDDWVVEALFGDSKSLLSTGQAGIERAIEDYAVSDLEQVVAGLELLNPKFQKRRLFETQ